MESFGLFDLLKSLLPARQEESVAPTSPSEPSALPDCPNVQANEPENPSVPENNKSNAYVDFLNRHDELAKRRRRK